MKVKLAFLNSREVAQYDFNNLAKKYLSDFQSVANFLMKFIVRLRTMAVRFRYIIEKNIPAHYM